MTEKFDVNRSEAFKVLCTCSKNTPTRPTKTTQLSKSVEQLTDNVHLATSAQLIDVFWIGGIPQLIVYLPHSDRFIAYHFVLRPRPTTNDRSS